MKITQVVFDYMRKDPRYPYHYRVGVSKDFVEDNLIAIRNWADTTEFPCLVLPQGVYVRDRKDAEFFVLKWA
jgi:hypothetical protein